MVEEENRIKNCPLHQNVEKGEVIVPDMGNKSCTFDSNFSMPPMHYRKTDGLWNQNFKPQKKSSWSQKSDLSFNQIKSAYEWHLSLSTGHCCTPLRTCCQWGGLESLPNQSVHTSRMALAPSHSLILLFFFIFPINGVSHSVGGVFP